MKRTAPFLIITGILMLISGIVINQYNTHNYETHNQISKEYLNDSYASEAFKEFISTKFSKELFFVKKMNHEENASFSDLEINYNIKGKTGSFFLLTKWVKELQDGMIKILDDGKMKSFEQSCGNEKVFFVLAIGGKPDSPDKLYIIPYKRENKNSQNLNILTKFQKKNMNANFFYDAGKNILK